MNIIGFIFENFFLVIIALWVLFSIFSKAGKQQGNQRDKGNQQAAGQPRQTRTRLPEQNRMPRQDQRIRHQQPLPDSLDRMPQVEYTAPLNVETQVDEIGQESSSIIIDTPVHHEAKLNNPFDTKELSKASVQGMMWKEVFGPPRAKEPFRRSGRRTYR